MQEKVIERTALVLEGGGFRGIFTAGVLDVLLKNELYFSYAIGISAGASYGVSYVSRQAERNLIVNDYISDKRYSSFRNLWREGSLFSWDFIYREMPENIVPLDYNAFTTSTTQFWVGVTNCITGKSEYFLLNPTDKNSFKDILAASCSLPFISNKISINNTFYLDGGLSDSIPFEHALNEGNNRAIVILTRAKGYMKKPIKPSWFFKLYYRKYPKVAELLLARAEQYNQSVKKLEELERQGKVFIIRPEKDIVVSRLENNPQKTKKAYCSALEQAYKQMPALKKWLAE